MPKGIFNPGSLRFVYLQTELTFGGTGKFTTAPSNGGDGTVECFKITQKNADTSIQ